MPMIKPPSSNEDIHTSPRNRHTSKSSIRIYTKDLVLIISVWVISLIFKSISHIDYSYAFAIALSIGFVWYIMGILITKWYKGTGFWKLGWLRALVVGLVIGWSWAIITFSSTIQSKYMINSSEQRRWYATDELSDIWSALWLIVHHTWTLVTTASIITGTTIQDTWFNGILSTGIVIDTGSNNTDVLISTGTVIPTTWWVTTTPITWSIQLTTWTTIKTPSINNTTTLQRWSTIKPVIQTSTQIQQTQSNKPLATILSLRKKSTNITFYELIPALMRWYRIPTSTKKDVVFITLDRTNPAYQYFKSAHYLRLIGRDVNINSPVKCEVYMVMIWIINKRQITSTDQWIIENYRTYASDNNKLNGCTRWWYVTGKQL